MKKIILLFVFLFSVSICFANTQLLVQKSLDQKVFLSEVKSSTSQTLLIATTFQAVEFGLVKCTNKEQNYNNFIFYNQNSYCLSKKKKEAYVPDINVIWLTNIKSK
jgi:hypothetical protein